MLLLETGFVPVLLYLCDILYDCSGAVSTGEQQRGLPNTFIEIFVGVQSCSCCAICQVDLHKHAHLFSGKGVYNLHPGH